MQKTNQVLLVTSLISCFTIHSEYPLNINHMIDVMEQCKESTAQATPDHGISPLRHCVNERLRPVNKDQQLSDLQKEIIEKTNRLNHADKVLENTDFPPERNRLAALMKRDSARIMAMRSEKEQIASLSTGQYEQTLQQQDTDATFMPYLIYQRYGAYKQIQYINEILEHEKDPFAQEALREERAEYETFATVLESTLNVSLGLMENQLETLIDACDNTSGMNAKNILFASIVQLDANISSWDKVLTEIGIAEPTNKMPRMLRGTSQELDDTIKLMQRCNNAADPNGITSCFVENVVKEMQGIVQDPTYQQRLKSPQGNELMKICAAVMPLPYRQIIKDIEREMHATQDADQKKALQETIDKYNTLIAEYEKTYKILTSATAAPMSERAERRELMKIKQSRLMVELHLKEIAASMVGRA